jgi:SHS2 domain-containing protein
MIQMGIESRIWPCYNDSVPIIFAWQKQGLPGQGLVELMSEQHFEVIDHTADWAIRVKGADLAQLFENAAIGMSILMAGNLAKLPLDVKRELELVGYDAESLLVEWLSELVYWAEMEQMVFRQFDLMEVTTTTLKAAVRGGRAPLLHKHIKAVTYHNLAIISSEDGVETTIVFDV